MANVAAGRFSGSIPVAGGPGSVHVYAHGTTTPASLYTDKIAGVAAPNPIITDANGFYSSFAVPGDYDLAWVEDDTDVTQTITVRADPSNPLVASTNTAGAAAVTAPTLGAAAQLAETTADAMLYIAVGTAGTLTIAIGPTSGVADVIVNGLAAAVGDLYTVRLPAGWFVAVTTSDTAAWTAKAVTC